MARYITKNKEQEDKSLSVKNADTLITSLRRQRKDVGVKRGPHSAERRAHISAATKGRVAHNKGKKELVKHVYYTNGIINIRIPFNVQPPEGFVRGRLKKPLTKDKREAFVEKTKSTKLQRYGDANYNNKQQGAATKLERYGDANFNNREAARETCLARYGVADPSQSPILMVGVAQRSKQTAIARGTINKSRPEELFYSYLCSLFGKEDVCTQYKDEQRYPFYCDFYIKSIDTFIELNLHWTHGFHPYNPESPKDQQRLAQMQQRVNQEGSAAYKSAIKIWTVMDPLKLKTAQQNKLNYITCYNQKKLLAHIKHTELLETPQSSNTKTKG